MNRLVRVVIPTFNRARLLPGAIESVLNQTAAHACRIVVVDDGSTDDTPAIAQRYHERITFIRKSNGGAASARNTALLAPGDEPYTAFLDVDDRWRPDKIERQLTVFEAHPEIDLCATGAVDVRSSGQFRDRPLPPLPLNTACDLAPALFDYNCLATLTVMLRTRALRRVGLFDVSLPTHEDGHLWTRIACGAPGFVLDAVLAEYAAEQPDSLTQQRARFLQTAVRVQQMLEPLLEQRPDCRRAWRRGMARAYAGLRDACYFAQDYRSALGHAIRVLRYDWRRPRWEWGRVAFSAFHWMCQRREETSDATAPPSVNSALRRTLR